ncbi:N-substituted formamide deformylase precursor [Luteitalea pratensis]|uniref:N-substituted formamide deformylase n=1 Tax=Luteitalea pratensis TaxID=1855912 RepID=A0A143PIP9_LUTPR|nr:N-substituted formamide deformylase precursor [Luteitalea pratensis]
MLLATALLSGCRPEAPEAPDLIVLNGKVWTGDGNRPEAEAIAIRNGRIVTVANSDVVRAMASAATRIIDVQGRRVVPGFNDAHWHLPLRQTADLTGAGTADEIVRRLKTFATGPADAWVLGDGWGPSDFPGLQPHRRHLDAAFPDRPVLITDRDGHQVLVNGRTLALAGITRDTPNPQNGRIGRDAKGEATGLLQEAAMSLVQRLLPPVSPDDADRAVLATLQKAATYGLTSVQDASASDPAGQRVAAYERAGRAGTLPIRVRVAMPFEMNVTPERLAELVRLRDEHRDRWLSFGIVKGVLDGTVDGHTAAMLAPYADRPNESGLPMWDQAALNAAVVAYDQAGLQIELHAVGDRAIRMALDAFARARSVNGTSERRHRIEHAELPSPEDLPRFRSLGVIASTQAMFASPDAITLTSFAPALGPERASRVDAFARFDDARIVQAFGSDYPVFTMEVMRGIHAAVTRQLPDGTPPGGWYPANRISVAAALRHFTVDAAFASREDQEKGALAPGRMADLVVLSEDVFAIPPERLWAVKATLTVVGGRVQWDGKREE